MLQVRLYMRLLTVPSGTVQHVLQYHNGIRQYQLREPMQKAMQPDNQQEQRLYLSCNRLILKASLHLKQKDCNKLFCILLYQLRSIFYCEQVQFLRLK